MAFGWLDDFLTVGGTIVSVFNPAIGAGMLAGGKALDAREKREQTELTELADRWRVLAIQLGDSEMLDIQKIETLKGAIRTDLWIWKKKQPNERDVEHYASIIVKGVHGDFSETES